MEEFARRLRTSKHKDFFRILRDMDKDREDYINRIKKLWEVEPLTKPDGIITDEDFGETRFYLGSIRLENSISWHVVQELFLAKMVRYLVEHDLSFGVVCGQQFAIIGGHGVAYAKTFPDALMEACYCLHKAKKRNKNP